jgi:putative membrane protein
MSVAIVVGLGVRVHGAGDLVAAGVAAGVAVAVGSQEEAQVVGGNVPTWKAELESLIQSAEKQTSVEFVLVHREKSSNYRSFRLSLSLVSFILVSWGGLLLYDLTHWEEFERQILHTSLTSGILVGLGIWILTRVPGVLRFLLLPSVLRKSVERGAELAFLEYEVFATRERSGVMIYISELEHAVQVIADQGLLPKIPEPVWAKLGADLAADLAQGGAFHSFREAIERILEAAKPHFPPREGNVNELPDQVR